MKIIDDNSAFDAILVIGYIHAYAGTSECTRPVQSPRSRRVIADDSPSNVREIDHAAEGSMSYQYVAQLSHLEITTSEGSAPGLVIDATGRRRDDQRHRPRVTDRRDRAT
jgi:hypothetical protein